MQRKVRKMPAPVVVISKLAIACLAMIGTGAQAQGNSTALSEPTVIAREQTGSPPTGLYSVVIEHDPGLTSHTIYRPRDLSPDVHSVLVWGEGGCADNNWEIDSRLLA